MPDYSMFENVSDLDAVYKCLDGPDAESESCLRIVRPVCKSIAPIPGTTLEYLAVPLTNEQVKRLNRVCGTALASPNIKEMESILKITGFTQKTHVAGYNGVIYPRIPLKMEYFTITPCETKEEKHPSVITRDLLAAPIIE